MRERAAYFGEANRFPAWAHGMVENLLQNWGVARLSMTLTFGPLCYKKVNIRSGPKFPCASPGAKDRLL